MPLTRQEKAKIVDRILAQPRTKRWRGAVDFYIKLNPELKKDHQEAVERVKQLKQEAARPTASTENMRLAISMPEGVMEAIKLFDPEFLEGDLLSKKHDLKLFTEVFPEYSVPRSY